MWRLRHRCRGPWLGEAREQRTSHGLDSERGSGCCLKRLIELSRCAAGGGERWFHDRGSVQFSREVARTRWHASRPVHIDYPSITKSQRLVELKDYRKPTRKEYARYVRKLAERFQCDPATLTADQLCQ